MKLDSSEADASPRLDWMAVRIQGKHFTSTSELVIDPWDANDLSEGKVQLDRERVKGADMAQENDDEKSKSKSKRLSSNQREA